MLNKSTTTTTSYSLVPTTPDSTVTFSETLQEAIDRGLIPIEDTVFRGGLLSLLKNIAYSAAEQLAFAQALDLDTVTAEAHKRVCEAVRSWYEVRGCYIGDDVCHEIVKCMNVPPRIFNNMDQTSIEMYLGKPGLNATLQWYLTWFAYFASDIGPLNPTLRYIDLGMDSINPVLTWVTPNMITYMSFIAGHRNNQDHLDLTFSELLCAVNVTRKPAIEQPQLKKSADDLLADTPRHTPDTGMRTETMQIPVCLMRLGGYTLAQRLLSSGALQKVSTTGDAAAVLGSLAELFDDDNVIMALPMLLISEATRQQCIRAIDTTFGMLNIFLQKNAHEKKPDWFTKMLPIQVVSQCMPIIMDVVIASVLELEGIQEQARELDSKRFSYTNSRTVLQRSQGNIVVTRKHINANHNQELVVEHTITPTHELDRVGTGLRNLVVLILDQLDQYTNHASKLQRFQAGLWTVDNKPVAAGTILAKDAQIQVDVEGVRTSGTRDEILQFIDDALVHICNTKDHLQALQHKAIHILQKLVSGIATDAPPTPSEAAAATVFDKTVSITDVSLQCLKADFQKIFEPYIGAIVSISQELARLPTPKHVAATASVLDVDGKFVGLDYDAADPEYVTVVSLHKGALHYINASLTASASKVILDLPSNLGRLDDSKQHKADIGCKEVY